MRDIRFRRAYFKDEEMKVFSHYEIWGLNVPEVGCNKFPGANNFALYHKDYWPTGLNDKNGKEIYEGDFVEVTFNNGEKLKGTMRYNPEQAAFKWYADGGDGYFLNSVAKDEENREIIGNIHENPELIS